LGSGHGIFTARIVSGGGVKLRSIGGAGSVSRVWSGGGG
jgi:hypothetical protein